jgi:hypothetical protein
MSIDQPLSAGDGSQGRDDVDEAALAEVLRTVPMGAAVPAGSAVALMVLRYLAIYILIFLPRGIVG